MNINIDRIRTYFKVGDVAEFEKKAIEAIKEKLPNLKSTGVMPLVEPNGTIRRSGDSIRYIDAMIQRFFNEGEIKLSEGRMAEHENRIFRERLQREHPRVWDKLQINTKYHISLIIQDQRLAESTKAGKYSEFVGQNILNLM